MRNKSPQEMNEDFLLTFSKTIGSMKRFRRFGRAQTIEFLLCSILAYNYTNTFVFMLTIIFTLFALYCYILSFIPKYVNQEQDYLTFLFIILSYLFIIPILVLGYLVFMLYGGLYSNLLKYQLEIFILFMLSIYIISWIITFVKFRRAINVGISKEIVNSMTKTSVLSGGILGLIGSTFGKLFSKTSFVSVIVLIISIMFAALTPKLGIEMTYMYKARKADKKYWEIPEEKNNNLD